MKQKGAYKGKNMKENKISWRIVSPDSSLKSSKGQNFSIIKYSGRLFRRIRTNSLLKKSRFRYYCCSLSSDCRVRIRYRIRSLIYEISESERHSEKCRKLFFGKKTLQINKLELKKMSAPGRPGFIRHDPSFFLKYELPEQTQTLTSLTPLSSLYFQDNQGIRIVEIHPNVVTNPKSEIKLGLYYPFDRYLADVKRKNVYLLLRDQNGTLVRVKNIVAEKWGNRSRRINFNIKFKLPKSLNGYLDLRIVFTNIYFHIVEAFAVRCIKFENPIFSQKRYIRKNAQILDIFPKTGSCQGNEVVRVLIFLEESIFLFMRDALENRIAIRFGENDGEILSVSPIRKGRNDRNKKSANCEFTVRIPPCKIGVQNVKVQWRSRNFTVLKNTFLYVNRKPPPKKRLETTEGEKDPKPIANSNSHFFGIDGENIEILKNKCSKFVGEKDAFGWTLLHHICRIGDLEDFKHLINEAGYVWNDKDHFGKTSLDVALYYRRTNISRFIISKLERNNNNILRFAKEENKFPVLIERSEEDELPDLLYGYQKKKKKNLLDAEKEEKKEESNSGFLVYKPSLKMPSFSFQRPYPPVFSNDFSDQKTNEMKKKEEEEEEERELEKKKEPVVVIEELNNNNNKNEEKETERDLRIRHERKMRRNKSFRDSKDFHAVIIRYIIRKESGIDVSKGSINLASIKKKEIILDLLERNKQFLSLEYDYLKLHHYCGLMGSFDLLKSLIEKFNDFFDLNSQISLNGYEYPMYYPLLRGNLDHNYVFRGDTILHICARKGRYDMVKWIMELRDEKTGRRMMNYWIRNSLGFTAYDEESSSRATACCKSLIIKIIREDLAIEHIDLQEDLENMANLESVIDTFSQKVCRFEELRDNLTKRDQVITRLKKLREDYFDGDDESFVTEFIPDAFKIEMERLSNYNAGEWKSFLSEVGDLRKSMKRYDKKKQAVRNEIASCRFEMKDFVFELKKVDEFERGVRREGDVEFKKCQIVYRELMRKLGVYELLKMKVEMIDENEDRNEGQMERIERLKKEIHLVNSKFLEYLGGMKMIVEKVEKAGLKFLEEKRRKKLVQYFVRKISKLEKSAERMCFTKSSYKSLFSVEQSGGMLQKYCDKQNNK